MNTFNPSQSFKAVLTGTLFIIVALLIMKIAYVFLASVYHNFSIDYPYLNEVNVFFRYLLAIPVFILIMFIGGYLAAGTARRKTLLHSFIVGVVSVFIMMVVALQSAAGITLTNLATYLVMLLATTAGGFYWKRKATT